MVTAASTADLAIVLVDARKGVLTQTRRHSRLLALLGVRRVVLAVNKMDLVAGSRDRFEAIVDDYRAFAGQIGLTDVTAIPTCARTGGNVSSPDGLTPWYTGPGLMAHLQSVAPAEVAPGPLRMAVQGVSRPDADFRGFAGRIVAGRARPGDAVQILPSGVSATISRIVTLDGDLDEASTGQSVTPDPHAGCGCLARRPYRCRGRADRGRGPVGGSSGLDVRPPPAARPVLLAQTGRDDGAGPDQ